MTKMDCKSIALGVQSDPDIPHEDKKFIMNFFFNKKFAGNDVSRKKLWNRVKPDDESTIWNL